VGNFGVHRFCFEPLAVNIHESRKETEIRRARDKEHERERVKKGGEKEKKK
jgi:hypothetical protein